jgi:hypothetical protein
VPPAHDAALGKAVRGLLVKLAGTIVAAALGAGGAVMARPAAAPERVEATRDRVAELERQLAREREDRLASDQQARELRRAVRCLRDVMGDGFEQLLPPVDRMTGTHRLRPWIDPCPVIAP